jgi:hypothetical protein
MLRVRPVRRYIIRHINARIAAAALYKQIRKDGRRKELHESRRQSFRLN